MANQGVTIEELVGDTVDAHIDGKLSELKTILLQLVSSDTRFPEYMELGVASNYLSVSRNTLNKYIRVYGLPVIKIEGVKRIAKSDLDEFMHQHAC